ncbi:uncharacterized protein LOC143208032 isoform X2 [Lasioglossum baleicum]|uniref:uncharacterized protein LOC143208032 isoform X2 n=1 Tax=Lasioglossum baleicum TaxID=434251 RepID=UPI003FCEDBF0
MLLGGSPTRFFYGVADPRFKSPASHECESAWQHGKGNRLAIGLLFKTRCPDVPSFRSIPRYDRRCHSRRQRLIRDSCGSVPEVLRVRKPSSPEKEPSSWDPLELCSGSEAEAFERVFFRATGSGERDEASRTDTIYRPFGGSFRVGALVIKPTNTGARRRGQEKMCLRSCRTTDRGLIAVMEGSRRRHARANPWKTYCTIAL